MECENETYPNETSISGYKLINVDKSTNISNYQRTCGREKRKAKAGEAVLVEEASFVFLLTSPPRKSSGAMDERGKSRRVNSVSGSLSAVMDM